MAAPSESLSTVDDVESTPQGVVKRWVAELELARATQEPWRKCSEEIWDLYRSKNRKSDSFNILWSNTETLRPALYNSSPRPDVRRRFRDEDPVGKVAANILERSLTYSIDAYDFDHVIHDAVLDVVLPGRGLARIKYVPKFREIESEPDALGLDPGAPPQEEVYDEKAQCAHVAWNTFLHGPGTTWEEVPWIAFEHDLPYADLKKMFGAEIADKIPLAEPDGTKNKSSTSDSTIRTLLKTGKFQEIWDREKSRVLFICETFSDGPLKVEGDPLRLSGFWPVPRPVYAIEDSNTLLPAPLYEKYKPQAEELNRVTMRINKVVNALKVRGAYASNLAEVAKIITAGDNEMLPIENAAAVATMGGLDKAIWIMPIEKLVLVLRELYIARQNCLQTIYEITGLGDIMRGVSNPHETLGAQELKSQWGTLRLQRLQREVQRFIRDLLRMKAEIMGEHFAPETFATMTGVTLPTPEEKQMAQQAMQQAQAAQQPAPPELQKTLALPTWDEVMALLKSDGLRQYRIDIETDSTVQETLQRDTQAMQETITAITNLFSTLGPAITQGFLSVDTVKTLAKEIARHARMGKAVEDAVDAIQQPPPQPAETDNSLEVAKVKAEADAQNKQAELQYKAQSDEAQRQADERIAAINAQAQAQAAAADAALKARDAEIAQIQNDQKAAAEAAVAEREHALKLADIENKRQLAMAEIESKAKTEEIRMRLERETELDKAHIQAETALQAAEIGAAAKAKADANKPKKE